MSKCCRPAVVRVCAHSEVQKDTVLYRKGQPSPESVRAEGAKQRYFNKYGWGVLSAVEKIAAEKSKSVSQIALAWLLSNDLVTSPIIGPRTLAQLNDNLGAAGLRLCPEDKKMLDAASDWKND